MSDDPAAPQPIIRRLVGVYNAESTLRGELAYVVGKRLGRNSCGLCEITHGALRERSDWKSCRASMPVPFKTYHRNDQPSDVRDLIGDDYPAVLADIDGGLTLLLGPRDLDACEASPALLVEAIERAAVRRQLRWG